MKVFESSKFSPEELGEYDDDTYFIRIRDDRDEDDSYCVTVFRYDDMGESIQIIRGDNSHGKGGHWDKLWIDDPDDGKDFNNFPGNLEDAFTHLYNNWKQYAKKYKKP